MGAKCPTPPTHPRGFYSRRSTKASIVDCQCKRGWLPIDRLPASVAGGTAGSGLAFVLHASRRAQSRLSAATEACDFRFLDLLFETCGFRTLCGGPNTGQGTRARG